MADIQSAAAEIRRGKKIEEEDTKKNKRQYENIFHRATITKAAVVTLFDASAVSLMHQITKYSNARTCHRQARSF